MEYLSIIIWHNIHNKLEIRVDYMRVEVRELPFLFLVCLFIKALINFFTPISEMYSLTAIELISSISGGIVFAYMGRKPGSNLCLRMFFAYLSIYMGGSEAIYEVSSKGADSFEVRALSYTNDLGGREIRLESALLPKINRKINSIIGYGRDLDDDGKIETWFLIEQNRGIYKFVAECEDTSCEKTIRNKVFNNYTKSSKMLFYSAYASLIAIFSFLLITDFKKRVTFTKSGLTLRNIKHA